MNVFVIYFFASCTRNNVRKIHDVQRLQQSSTDIIIYGSTHESAYHIQESEFFTGTEQVHPGSHCQQESLTAKWMKWTGEVSIDGAGQIWLKLATSLHNDACSQLEKFSMIYCNMWLDYVINVCFAISLRFSNAPQVLVMHGGSKSALTLISGKPMNFTWSMTHPQYKSLFFHHNPLSLGDRTLFLWRSAPAMVLIIRCYENCF